MANQSDQYQKVNIDQVGTGEKFLDTLNILPACTRRGVWAAFVCYVSVTEPLEGSVNIDAGLGGGAGRRGGGGGPASASGTATVLLLLGSRVLLPDQR